MKFSNVTRIVFVSLFYWYQNIIDVRGQTGGTTTTPQNQLLLTNGNSQPIASPQSTMQPGVQPGIQPGIQPEMQSGMQLGMQPGMQSTIQPQAIMPNPPMQNTPISQPVSIASVPGFYPTTSSMQPMVTNVPYYGAGPPNYPPTGQWSNSPIPGLANPYQQSQQIPSNVAPNGWQSYQNQPIYTPNSGYQSYRPHSAAEAAGQVYTNAQYETLMQNPESHAQLQNIINTLYRKQYPNGSRIGYGGGTTVVQTQGGFSNPIQKKFDTVMNLMKTFTNKGTWAPLTGDLPVVSDAINNGSNMLDSGLDLVHRVGTSVLGPNTTSITRLPSNGNAILVN